MLGRQGQVPFHRQTSKNRLDDAVAAERGGVRGQEFGFHSRTLSPKKKGSKPWRAVWGVFVGDAAEAAAEAKL